MNLYPAESVEEESSDSCDEEEEEAKYAQGQDDAHDPLEFNPKNFYWVFNPDMNFSSRVGFSLEADINPQDFMEMRRLNRRILTQFFQDQKNSAKEKKIRDFDFGASRDQKLESPSLCEVDLKFE